MRRYRGKSAVSGPLLAFIFMVGVPLYLLAQVVPGESKSSPSKETYIQANNSNVAFTPQKDEIGADTKEQVEPDISFDIPEATSEVDLGPGATDDDPIVLTASELIRVLNEDIETAQDLYKYKWLKVTGLVVSVTHNEVKHWTRTYMGKTTHNTTGEVQYTIAGVTIKSGLIYWINNSGYRNGVDIIAEMDMSLCDVYYPQRSKVTVIGYCAGLDENDIVLTDGRYPSE